MILFYIDDISFMTYYSVVGAITMLQAINILEKLSQRRRDLKMSYDELGRRSGVSISTLKRVISGEETANFSTVTAIAEALGLHFGNAPAEDIAVMRERQAHIKAKAIVSLVQGTSALEGQAVLPQDIELMEQRTVAELLTGPARRLWAS
jgi:transcriptional regulator with XRE-family HTH domain